MLYYADQSLKTSIQVFTYAAPTKQSNSEAKYTQVCTKLSIVGKKGSKRDKHLGITLKT